MVSARRDVAIDRPIEEVFDFLADGTNNPRWQSPVITATRVGDSSVRPGPDTAFRQRVRHPLGFTMSGDYRITDYQRPIRLTATVTAGGPLRPVLRYELSADGPTVTVVSATVELPLVGAARAAGPVLALLHPLLAWEAGWVEHARDVLEARVGESAT